MNSMKRLAVRYRIAAASLAGLSLGLGVLAFHQEGQSGFNRLAERDRQECSGSHCTVIATWIKPASGSDHLTLTGTLSMDTHLVAAGMRNAAGNPPPFEGGDRVDVPVEATGEFGGYGATLFDSPPITFLPGGVLHVETQGVAGCEITTLLTGPEPEKARCKPLPSLPDAAGTWVDAVRVFGPNAVGGYTVPATAVSCAPTSAGNLVTCTSQSGFTGRVMVELRRTVDNVRWNGVGVVAVSPPGPQFVGNNPFPAMMVSTAFVDFAQALPDLVVEEDVVISPASPVVGNMTTFTARVRNVGSRVAGPSETQLRIDIGSDGSWEVGPTRVPTGSLNPAASEVETWTWTALQGTHRAEICADARNAVQEINEDNCVVRVFRVFAPPSVSLALPPSVLVGASAQAIGSVTDPDRDLQTRTWIIAKPGCVLDLPPAPVPPCAERVEGPAPDPGTFTEATSLPTDAVGRVCVRLTATDARELTGTGSGCSEITQQATPTPPPSPGGTPRGVAPPLFREIPPGGASRR